MLKSRVLTTVARRWDNLMPPSTADMAVTSKFFAGPSEFLWSAGSMHQLPHTQVPELVFLGRSNVGKSTLLNTLMNRTSRKLARTSKRAGRTQSLNGYAMRDVTLVDTPGYGHRSRVEWGPMIMAYLTQRSNMRRAVVLVEASHGFKSTDEELMTELGRRGVPFQVVLTKSDKLNQSEMDGVFDAAEQYLRTVGKAAVWGEVVAVASERQRAGLLELRCSLLVAAGILKPRYKSVATDDSDASEQTETTEATTRSTAEVSE